MILPAENKTNVEEDLDARATGKRRDSLREDSSVKCWNWRCPRPRAKRSRMPKSARKC